MDCVFHATPGGVRVRAGGVLDLCGDDTEDTRKRAGGKDDFHRAVGADEFDRSDELVRVVGVVGRATGDVEGLDLHGCGSNERAVPAG